MIPKKKLADGIEIPVIGLGTWQLEKEACTKAVKMALEIGYRHIDTAYAYYNHEDVKKGLEGFPRDKYFLTTKLWREHLSPEKVEYACDICLKDLNIDYIDLFLIHWPDRYIPSYKTIEEMHKLKEKGKIRSVGVSNFTTHHIKDVLDTGLSLSVNQVEFHPYLNQIELLEFCEGHSIAVTAYSPLAHAKVFKDPIIQDIGKKYSKTPGQISLRWLLQKKMIVIPKGSSWGHIKENFEIFDFELSNNDMKRMEDIHLTHSERQIIPDFQEFDY